jgi:hypothetical protein
VIKNKWKKAVHKEKNENAAFVVNNTTFIDLLVKLMNELERENISTSIMSAFKVCGIFPWNVENFRFNRLISKCRKVKPASDAIILPSYDPNIERMWLNENFDEVQNNITRNFQEIDEIFVNIHNLTENNLSDELVEDCHRNESDGNLSPLEETSNIYENNDSSELSPIETILGNFCIN